MLDDELYDDLRVDVSQYFEESLRAEACLGLAVEVAPSRKYCEIVAIVAFHRFVFA